jgi:CYTH domain-containing protein
MKYKKGDLVQILDDIKDAYEEVWHKKGDVLPIAYIAEDGEGLMFDSKLGIHYSRVKLVESHNNTGKEIERKFLVTSKDYLKYRIDNHMYIQGYLSGAGPANHKNVVRVRIDGTFGKAWITVKGVNTGCTRMEYEYEIPVKDAKQLINLCEGIVDKNRHFCIYKRKNWYVDEFLGPNSPLVVAEIELKKENEKFQLPPWVGEEVTNSFSYYCSMLAYHPYNEWDPIITGIKK